VSEAKEQPIETTDMSEPPPWRKIALVAGLIALPLIGIITVSIVSRSGGGSGSSSSATTLDWQTLRELNHETGERSAKIAGLDGKRVRIPGFMVPLEDNAQRVTEFLLVSNPQACIHVPAPPPNQMVHVHMVGKEETKMSWGPVWVEGMLRISTISSVYGNSSYQLMSDHTEAYKVE